MQNCLFWGRAVVEVLTNLNEWQKSVNTDLLFGLKCCIFVLTYRKPCGFLFFIPIFLRRKTPLFRFPRKRAVFPRPLRRKIWCLLRIFLRRRRIALRRLLIRKWRLWFRRELNTFKNQIPLTSSGTEFLISENSGKKVSQFSLLLR